jgi:hypothetical protein
MRNKIKLCSTMIFMWNQTKHHFTNNICRMNLKSELKCNSNNANSHYK